MVIRFSFPLLSFFGGCCPASTGTRRPHSFSYICFFSQDVFYTVVSFNEASEDTVFSIFFLLYCCLLLYWLLRFLFLTWVPLHPPYEGKCQNNERLGMADRRQHVRRRQLPESPSAGSGDSLLSSPWRVPRPVVHRESGPPSTLNQPTNSLSSSLSIIYIPTERGGKAGHDGRCD